jgi:RNA recognition motif-containing protein
MNLYIGNLPYGVTEDDIKAKFSEFGELANINLVMDRFTGESKGFGFIEYANNSDADKAIKSMNGAQFGGRTLKVNQAKPKDNQSRNRPRY